MNSLWERTLAELRTGLPSQEFAAWISCLRSSDQGRGLTVEAPTAFHRNWVQQHFLDRIRATAESVAGHPVAVSLAVGGPLPTRIPPPPPPAPRRTPRGASLGTQACTFETLVVGDSNALAHAAARSVVEEPGRHYNPLFVHGGVGLGKTHLLYAIAHELRERSARRRILALGAERFINEMVTAIRRQQMETFHQRFRRLDVLLVDDVQFLAGKERTQEEFLHTFNLLCAAGKQIVLTSDKPPRAIPQLETGLRSRFEGGMAAEITPPDRAMRQRILERKATSAGVALSAEVTAYLADHVRAVSVRELEGAITRLRALASLAGRPIDLTLAREAIEPMCSLGRERVSAERVEMLVGAALGIAPSLLTSPQRSSTVVLGRQIAMYLLKRLVGLSLNAIGERYGRDHTTVLHAVRVIETRRACNPEVRRLVMSVEDKL